MSRVPRVHAFVVLFALSVSGAVAPPDVAAQGSTGAVEGRVTQADNGRPVANARLVVVGTTLRAETNEAGEFRIAGVPARQVELRARLIGFSPLSKTVVVTNGETVRADFSLTVSALQLDQVVVTGTGQQVEARKLGNTVAVIQPPENMPINDISMLLQGREPGLTAISSAGLTGTGARIRVRGNASLTQSNEPIFFLDGIRINSGGGQTSRIEDIDPASIERIEILKGAAAATLYGTEASNGVIQLFTKRGTNGPPRWRFSLDQEAIQFPDRVAPNSGYARTQAQADSLATYWGKPGLQAFEVFEVPLWKNYLTETGVANTMSGQVTGGGSIFNYFASGRYQYENGPIGGTYLGPAKDDLRRIQTRVNLSLMPVNNVRLGLQTGYYNTVNGIPGGGIIGNSIYGTYALAAYARPEAANCNRSTILSAGKCSGVGNAFGNQAFMTVRESMQQITEQAIQRYHGVVSGTYTPLSELSIELNGGWDVANTRGFSFSRFRYDVDEYTTNNIEGSRSVQADQARILTLDAKSAWNRDLFPSLSSSLVTGMQVFHTRSFSSGGSSTNLPGPGIEVVGAGGQNISVNEGLSTTVNGGFFAQEQFGFRNHSFLTVGGRYDYASAFGAESPGVFYPKASLSVVPSEMAMWGNGRFGLNTLRVRLAWGQSGKQPGAFDKFTTFSPLRGELGAGLAPSNLGNPGLKPEVATEIEGGFEAGVWNNRVGLNATAWHRTVNDLLIARQFAPSGGFRSTQLDNIGQAKAHGLELSVLTYIISRPNLGLEFSANAASLSQTLTSLGGSPVIKTNAGYVRHRVFLKEGAPLGSIYVPRMAVACPSGNTPAQNKAGQPIACYGPGEYPISLNGNGRAATQAEMLAYLAVPRDLKTTAVQNALRPLLADYDGTGTFQGGVYVPNLSEQRIGKIFPDWTGTFGPTITYRNNWRMSGLFEWRTGFLVHNLTYAFRSSQHATIGSNLKPYSEVEAVLNNPASTAQQRLDAADRYIKNYRRLLEPGLNEFEKGDFLKFRELALTYSAPQHIAARFRANSMALTFAARNIGLWTPYSGSDPEIAYNGREAGGGVQGNFNDASDSFGMPVPRRFSLLLNLGY